MCETQIRKIPGPRGPQGPQGFPGQPDLSCRVDLPFEKRFVFPEQLNIISPLSTTWNDDNLCSIDEPSGTITFTQDGRYQINYQMKWSALYFAALNATNIRVSTLIKSSLIKNGTTITTDTDNTYVTTLVSGGSGIARSGNMVGTILVQMNKDDAINLAIQVFPFSDDTGTFTTYVYDLDVLTASVQIVQIQ